MRLYARLHYSQNIPEKSHESLGGRVQEELDSGASCHESAPPSVTDWLTLMHAAAIVTLLPHCTADTASPPALAHAAYATLLAALHLPYSAVSAVDRLVSAADSTPAAQLLPEHSALVSFQSKRHPPDPPPAPPPPAAASSGAATAAAVSSSVRCAACASAARRGRCEVPSGSTPVGGATAQRAHRCAAVRWRVAEDREGARAAKQQMLAWMISASDHELGSCGGTAVSPSALHV